MSETPETHILVIDDSADIQVLLRLFLEAKGHAIVCRSNGMEALALLLSGQPLPDLIMVDLRMPVMDGYTFLTRKAEEPILKGIPTILTIRMPFNRAIKTAPRRFSSQDAHQPRCSRRAKKRDKLQK